MVFSFLAFSLVSAVQACEPEQVSLRFTCSEAREFATAANDSIGAIMSYVQRSRELAIQAANGTLGASDRAFLNSEYNQIVEEVNRIFTQSYFTDNFYETHRYLNDGLHFKLRVKSDSTGAYYVKVIDIPSYQIEHFGQIYAEEFQVANVDPRSVLLKLNGVSISRPENYEDTVSYQLNGRSAIAWARKINDRSGSTTVRAEVGTTTVRIEKVNAQALPDMLTSGTFMVNGISVRGSLGNLMYFIDRVNEYSNQTGVKARVIGANNDGMEFYATDGRNIDFHLTGDEGAKLSFAFNGILQTGVSQVFISKMRLRSGKAFSINQEAAALFGLEGAHEVALDNKSFATNSMSTQAGAQDSLSILDQALSQTWPAFTKVDEILKLCPKSATSDGRIE